MKVSAVKDKLSSFGPKSCIFVMLGKESAPYCVSIEDIRQVEDGNAACGEVVLIRAYEISGGKGADQLDDPKWFMRKSKDTAGLVRQVSKKLASFNPDADVMLELGPNLKPYRVEITQVEGFADVSLEDEYADYVDCISVVIRGFEIPENFVATKA